MPNRPALLALSITVAAVAGPAAAQEAGGAPAVDFQREVRPILADNCFQCHGPDESTRQVRLRLDTEAGAFAARPNGQPVVPGDAAASLVYQRVAHDDPRRRMPPPALSPKTLTEAEVDVLRRWIDEGASWEQHWAFETIARPDAPDVADAAWARGPLDRFVLARLEAEGLAPAPEADPRTLARRVALDLTGLPPDPETLEAFVRDPSDAGYERLVDRLLASVHWGEHRARYWLDAARYGDTHGIHIDNYREMYPYRDWVIDAFNANKPFDAFTVEQIAGDLLPEPTLDQLVATGFQRNNITTNEGGVVPEEYEVIYAKDRAETIGGVYLGLTVGCATCHDHKFDPIAQSEFYALTAFFRNTTQYVMDGNVSDPPPILVVPEEADRARWSELRAEAAETEAGIARRAASVDAAFTEWLATGAYRALRSPLDRASEWMRLDLDPSGPVFRMAGQQHPVTLGGDARVGAGPHGLPALTFGSEAAARLPSLPLDADTPFSLALWVYQPEAEGNFAVAGQYDPDDGSRGWAMTLGSRQLSFRMTGDEDPDEPGRPSPRIAPSNLKRMPPGEWTHVVITHDGSGERAGLNVFRDGDVVEASGSEFFTKVLGSIRNERPLLLGRSATRRLDGPDDPETRYFEGGGIADLRIFDRALTVQEARVVSLWPALERARGRLLHALDDAEREALRVYFLSVEDAAYRRLLARSQAIEREWREMRRRGGVTHVMHERPDSEPEAHVLDRGMYDQPRERVAAGVPAALPPLAASLPRNRLGLARWLVDDANPLTSRVTVNRFWQQVFGTGLVATSEDFGAQGDTPTHPELLDWLASEFRASGWDVKRFFRMLVTSATYRQSAAATPEKRERDPENRLLSRGPRFRMDAEVVRDYALAASGLLVRTVGGPSVRPYQPAGVWSTVAMTQSNTRLYRQDEGDRLYRRSLYTFWKRSAPPPSMEIFNAPTREHFTVRRERTNTPLQALVVMNDPQFVEASRHLAQRALRGADGFDARLDFVTARLVARSFDDAERAVARTTYGRLLEAYEADTDAAGELLAVGASAPDGALPAAESAAWTMLVNQVLNLDEVLNK